MPKTNDRCPKCLGTLPYRGGLIPVQGCECGACACTSCINWRRKELGLAVPPPSENSAGGILTVHPPEDYEPRYHRVVISASAYVGEHGASTAQRAAEWLADSIREMLGIGSTAGLIIDERVEGVVEVPGHDPRVVVSALVPVAKAGDGGYGKTPEDAAEWFLRMVKDCCGSGSSGDTQIWDEQIENIGHDPERGCSVCYDPPCHVGDDVSADGVCGACESEREDEEARTARVQALLAQWRPQESPSASATVFGRMHFYESLRPKSELYGLIREFGPEGQRRLVALWQGEETVRELGPHALADVLHDFVPGGRFCGHGTDGAYYPCAECAKQMRYFLDGMYRRPVL